MSLDDFKTNIKYRLGYPVINIELSPEQFDLAIKEAITFYQRNHFDGSEQIYMPIRVTQEIKDNRYVALGDEVIGVNGIFDIVASGSGLLTTDFIIGADAAWQAFRSGGGMTGYYNMMSYRNLIQQTFTGKTPVRFNYNRGRVFIDASSGKFEVDSWLMFDTTVVIDPADSDRMFSDPWLLDYAECLVKRMWGATLKKYQQVQLPGGVMLDGQTMYQEANETKEKMEEDIISKFQLPISFMVG